MGNEKFGQHQSSYSVNIDGNATGVQIQQGTVNSSQIQITNDEFDYTKAREILIEISKYKAMFPESYGKNCIQAENALNEAMDAVANRANPSKVKNALHLLKDITLRVSSTLISTGILGLLNQIKI